jgi:hypothetical protein
MPLLAGAAVRDISPIQPCFLVGYPHVPRTSTGVHDPLLASALCLRDHGQAVILLALDLLFLDPPTARRLRHEIARRNRVPEAHVFISCTHTHSGPVTSTMLAWQDDPVVPAPDPAYMARLADQVAAAAAEACATAEPATMAWTAATVSGVGGNRLSPDAERDPEAGILVVHRANRGGPLAMVVVYSMHPTVLHEDSTLISGDFPAYTRLHLRERFGRDLAVLYHTGPCGNQSPRYHVSGQTFAEAERLGRRLGAAVAEAAALAPVPGTAGRETALGGRVRRVDLPVRPLPCIGDAERGLAEARANYEALRRAGAPHGPVRTAECAVFGAEERLTLARSAATGAVERLLAAYLPAEVQVVRLGDTCLAGLPGEVFVEYGLAIKRGAARRTFPVSLVNGELQGYIVTPAAALAGGYEANNALFAAEAGARLVDAARAAVNDLG